MSRTLVWVFLSMFIRVAWGQQPLLNCSVESKGEVWVGQRVTLVVELLSPTYFAGSAAFDLPRVPGIVIYPPEMHPTVGTQTVDNIRYTSQRHELWIFAQRAGRIDIPPFAVRFEVSGAGGAEPSDVRLMTSRLSFDARLPPGAEGLATVISTPALSVQDDWQPRDTTAKVGDAFTHQITLIAEDVPGMAFPPIPALHTAGLGIYPKPAIVQDETDRGTLRGRRTETIVYVCQSAGNYVVPPFTLRWWDLNGKTLKTAHISGHTIHVAAAPMAAGMEKPVLQSPRRGLTLESFVTGLIVACAFAAGFWMLTVIRRRRRPSQMSASKTERQLFDACVRACRHDDLPEAYRALMRWWQAAAPIDPPRSITDYLTRQNEPQLAAAVERMEFSLFADPKSVNNAVVASVRSLEPVLKKMRKGLRRRARDAAPADRTLLPLNPSPSPATASHIPG